MPIALSSTFTDTFPTGVVTAATPKPLHNLHRRHSRRNGGNADALHGSIDPARHLRQSGHLHGAGGCDGRGNRYLHEYDCGRRPSDGRR
ncbi:MAG: hypothetical protein MZV64_05230 [Ignavibacteriales bacterium]|nr:hypothetical protein [Ignavibacteriales bacterium]